MTPIVFKTTSELLVVAWLATLVNDFYPLGPDFLVLDLGETCFDSSNELLFWMTMISQLKSLLNDKIAVAVLN